MILPVDYTKLSPSEKKKVREIYIKKQKGLCYHCKGVLTTDPPNKILNKVIHERYYPKDFFKYPIHLHHDHNTGMTLGVVHCYCNAVLWEYYGE